MSDPYHDLILGETGLVAYYPMHDASGTTCADIQGTNNGTYAGGFTLGQTGLTALGTGVLFDGTTGKVTIPDSSSLQLVAPFTIEAWVKTTESGSSTHVFGKHSGSFPFSGYGLNMEVGKAAIWVGDITHGTVRGVALVDDGSWHHVVVQLESDAHTCNIYVDGVLDKNDVRDPSLSNTAIAMIAGDPPTNGPDWAGTVSNIAVYSVKLSSTQVASHYATGIANPTTYSLDATSSLAFTNVAAGPAIRVASVAESLGFGEVDEGENAKFGAATDAVAFADSAHTDRVGAAVADPLSLTDSAVAVKVGTWIASATDGIAFADQADCHNTVIRLAVVESLGFGAGTPVSRSAGDSAGFSDVANTAGGTIPLSVVESVHFFDTSSTTGPIITMNAVESIGFMDYGGPPRTVVISQVETVNLGDGQGHDGEHREIFTVTDRADARPEITLFSENLAVRDSADTQLVLPNPDLGLSIVLRAASAEWPVGWCETPDGLVMISNGMDRVMRWNSSFKTADTAGVLPPTTAMTLSNTQPPTVVAGRAVYTVLVPNVSYQPVYNNQKIIVSTGGGVNSWTFYLTYGAPDFAINATNTLPTKQVNVNPAVNPPNFQAQPSANASVRLPRDQWNRLPDVVTKAWYYVDDGSPAPEPADQVAAAAVPVTFDVTPVYTAFVRFVDLYGNPSDLSPISNALTAGVPPFIYTDVPVPSETKVRRRQIFRATAGQSIVYYLDIDTDDLSSTTFTSLATDEELLASLPLVLFAVDGSPLANLYGVPPSHKAVYVSHLGRIFASVEYDYATGHVAAVTASTAVRGYATRWTDAMVGRVIYVYGDSFGYLIESVDVDNQVLTLSVPYVGVSGQFKTYAIRSDPSQRRVVYYSEAGLPESWPVINGFQIPEDGDEITGLCVNGSFLYIVENRHIYKFTAQADPAKDGFIFLSTNRGCVGQRCMVQVDGSYYMLDEQGCHQFQSGQTQSVSDAIQDVFQPGAGSVCINWNADRRYWHAAWDGLGDTIRWFVTFGQDVYPRNAICLNYRTKRWWFEQYEIPIASSGPATIFARRSLVGSEARQVFVLGEGDLDGVDSALASRGRVESSSVLSLTTEGPSLVESLVRGRSVAITSGKGQGQVRNVSRVVGRVVTVDRPWTVFPDATSVYQFGGFSWAWQSGWFRFSDDEQCNPRDVEVIYRPVKKGGEAQLQVYYDHSDDPNVWSIARNDDGLRVRPGSPKIEVNLAKRSGYVQQRMTGHKETYVDGLRFVSVGLSGISTSAPIRVYSVIINGAGQ